MKMNKALDLDPTIAAIKKAQSVGPTDILQPQPTNSQRDSAAYSLPQLRGTVEEVDEALAIVVFSIPAACAGTTDTIDVEWAARRFRGVSLLSPGGSKVGTITSASADRNELELTADIDNTGVLASLLSGEFIGVAVIAQSLSRYAEGSGSVHCITPLSVRLVAAKSDVNSDMNVSKSFVVRREDGTCVKRAFAGSTGHAGTGRGSGAESQIATFKKIHASGGLPLTGEQLMKISSPRKSERPEHVRLTEATRELRKIQREGRRPLTADALAKLSGPRPADRRR